MTCVLIARAQGLKNEKIYKTITHTYNSISNINGVYAAARIHMKRAITHFTVFDSCRPPDHNSNR